jgi:nitrite reductase (NO-forming)
MKSAQHETQAQQDTAKGLAVVRIAFGVVWLVDAVFKFEPAFYHGILGVVKAADAGEPNWLNPWFHAWYSLIGSAAGLFAVAIIVIESLIALSLLSGLARRTAYLGGAIFSFLIWSVAEGFGGPYVAGSTDIGAGIIYVLLFGLLYVVDTAKVPAYSLVPVIAKLHKPSGEPLLKNNRRKARAEA